jgi:large conductance mechanosensitive channel
MKTLMKTLMKTFIYCLNKMSDNENENEKDKILNFLFNSNVINLLIAVVIGKAFADLIQSTVSDIILPFLNYSLNGSLNVSSFSIKLGVQNINYGKSLGLFITLLISIFTLYYFFIRPFNSIIIKNEKIKEEKQIETIKKVIENKEQFQYKYLN